MASGMYDIITVGGGLGGSALAKTMAEKITAQRNWAAGRARNANVIRAVKSDGDAQPIA